MAKPTINDIIAVLTDIADNDIPEWDLDPGFYGELCDDPALIDLDSYQSAKFAQMAVRMAIEIVRRSNK